MDELEQHLLVETAGWFYTSLRYRNLSARLCALYYFLLEGALTGIWSVSLAYIQDNLDLSDSKLGLAVFFSALGTAITAPITAYFLKRFGVKHVALVAGVAYSGFLPLLGLSHTLVILCVTMFVYGLAWGMVDISANNSAILTEMVEQKTLLGSFHGSYSLAAAIGSLVGAAMTTNDVGILTMFLIAFAVFGSLSVVFSFALYTQEQEKVIANYNNHMAALYQRANSQNQSSTLDPNLSSDSRAQETVNEIIAGYDASELSDALEPKPRRQSEPLGLEDQNHITYTTDWRVGDDVWMHTEQGGPDDGLLAPLVAGQFAGQLPRPYPAADRSRLLSADIGNYEVRSSRCNSTVNDGDASSPHLLLYLCCLSFLAAFGEGSLVTWMVIYYDNVLGADSIDKSAGFICFMVAMAMGRFACDYLRRLYGRKIMVFVGGVLAAVGVLVVFLVSTLPTQSAIALSSIGLMIAGFGLATLLPIAFSSAGHLTGAFHSGTAVATVAVCAYCGSIAGSPLVGALSDITGSLRYGFLFIALVLAAVAPLSALIPSESLSLMQHGEPVNSNN
jgi:MFS family permease